MLTMRRFTPGGDAPARGRPRRHGPPLRRPSSSHGPEAADGEPLDLVANLSVGVPLATICGMMGVPESDWTDILALDRHADVPRPSPPSTSGPGRRLRDIRRRLGPGVPRVPRGTASPTGAAAARRRRPGHASWSHATIDGEPLNDQQLHGYLSLLIGAGNETTRNAITGGVKALLEHPAERDRLAADPDGLVETAVEEILRWTSPVIQFARTATGRLRAGRHHDPGRRHGRAVVPVGQPRRAPVPRPLPLRRRPHAEPPPRVRLRTALLPRRQPGPLGAAGRVPRAGAPPAPPRAGRRSRHGSATCTWAPSQSLPVRWVD